MDKLADITAQGWILAYFIRSDGERFLLGTGAYDFKSDLQHFQPNTMANDIVELQGTDGQLIAGQVRRSATQSFNGYIGDSTQNRQTIEAYRRDFLMFFRKNFFYKVIYIFPNGEAIQRKRGYLVDAPSVPELYQFFPEYHVGLNFEDPDYYEYAENEDGDEIYANIREILIAQALSDGLVWDAIGAVSNGYTWSNPQTASGSAFQITGIEGAPLTLTEITGNATQNGTPTPDAPVAVNTTTGENVVKITGKNLIDKNSITIGKFINASGVEADDATALVSNYINIQPNTDYYISGRTAWNSIALYNQNKTFLERINLSYVNGIVNITNTNCAYIRINGASTNADTIQLELGSTATDFEPYQGQEYEVNLGKNLFDKNNAHILQAGITTTKIESATANRTLWIPCEPSTTYTIQKRNDGDTNRFNVATTAVMPAIDVAITNRVENPNASSITYTTSANARYLCVQYFRTAETILTEQQVLDSIQIEKGSTATSYAPYFTPIELAKIGTYQDRIYKDDGKWYIEKQIGKYTFDGTEGWVRSGNTTATHFVSALSSTNLLNHVQVSYAGRASSLMTHFTFEPIPSQSTLGSNEGLYALYNQTNDVVSALAISLDINDAPDIATARTWITNHSPSLYYPLATPTTTEITDSTLLAQLNFIANLYGGTNNIMLVGTGAQGEIGVQYMTEVDTAGAGYEWEAGGGGSDTTITVAGVDAVQPVWEVQGPATDPTLTNITTNQTITWQSTVPAGQTLTVDMNRRTATMAGANVFQFITGDWISLEPGNNRLSYTASGGATDPSTISWNGVVG